MVNTALSIVAFLMLVPVMAYAVPGSIEVDLDGTLVTVEYDAEGVSVTEIEANADVDSLTVYVRVDETPGILEITFEREFFDSRFGGTDEEFIIVADGLEPDSEEIDTNDQSRTLRMELEEGTDEIEIFGSVVGGIDSEPTADEPPEEPAADDAEPTDDDAEPRDSAADDAEPVDDAGQGDSATDDDADSATDDTEPADVEDSTPEPATDDADGDGLCGEGTVWEDGSCVLESRAGQTGDAGSSVNRSAGNYRDLIVGAGAGLVAAFVIAAILWIISKASRERKQAVSVA